jgi:hypothetical protein
MGELSEIDGSPVPFLSGADGGAGRVVMSGNMVRPESDNPLPYAGVGAGELVGEEGRMWITGSEDC